MDYDCFVIICPRLTLWCRGAYGVGGEHETDASARSYGGLRPRCLKLFSQSGNVGVDHVGARIEMHVPHFVMQLAPRYSLTSLQHQVLEQLELHRCEIQFFGVAGDASGKPIEREVPHTDLFTDSSTRRAAPNQGAHSCP